MEYWQQFMRFDYANEVLMAVGGLCVIVALLQIVRSSLKMVFWVIIGSIGLFSANFGMQQEGYHLPGMGQWQQSRLSALASNLDQDVLLYLCQKIGFSETLSEPDPPQ